MKRIGVLVVLSSALALTGCGWPKLGQAYWQRVEDNSALYMTGPKAQQRLDEDIASCVREIDELVRLDAVRGTTPPDTYSEYNRALNASGDLAYYDTPTHDPEKKVAHTNYHDFDSCMRYKGWERVRYIRYQTQSTAKQTYRDTQAYRKEGLTASQSDARFEAQVEAVNANYENVNK